jgi:hypothetical protein
MYARHFSRMNALLFAVLLAASCAPAVRSPDGPGSSRDVITRAELDAAHANHAFEAVEELRPQWLRRTGPTSVLEPAGNLPSVYIDNVRAGDLEALREVPIYAIEEIRLVSPADATTRWGTGLAGGVIWVIRRG